MMNAGAQPGNGFLAMRIVARGVMIELLRRKDLYVLTILMGAFLAGVLAARSIGIENASTGTFLLNLGLTLGCICAHILTLIFAARQIPDEVENRTLHTMLAKPVSRMQFLLGKWISCALAGAVSLIALQALCLICTPWMEAYSSLMLAQMFILECASLALMSALAILFSLLAPRGAGIVLLAFIGALGPRLTDLCKARYADSPLAGATGWLLEYLPDFSRLNLVTRFTDGIAALPAGEFAGLLLYAVVLIFAALVFSAVIFERRPL
ncbi:ABC transporter permease subunit [Candidatus Sumerlaeota bacterium]|nr:ABC transporter permease subunit [Candidatus Sumerlaeota bacterium]